MARLALLALLALAPPASAALPAPYDTLYHSTDAILAEFAALAQRHPDTMAWQPPAAGDEGSLGVGTLGAPSESAASRPKLLLVFGEHARELITSDTALWLARVLTGETTELDAWPEAAAALAATASAGAPAARSARPSALAPWAAALLQQVTLVLVPVEVPSSRRAVEEGQTCRRKTLQEVDLNRNWGTAWKKHPHSAAEEFSGAAPFSEPQSRALRDLATRLAGAGGPLAAYVNVHSGEYAMYVPWDHKNAHALGLPADAPALLDVLNTHCRCTRGAGGAASTYLAFGTSMDWMWQELHVPYPLTFELYGGGEEGRRPADWALGNVAQEGFDAAAFAQTQRRLESAGAGCLPMFNPGTTEAYRSVVASWVHNFLLLAEHIAAVTPAAIAAASPPPAPAAVAAGTALPPPVVAVLPRKALRPAGERAGRGALEVPSRSLRLDLALLSAGTCGALVVALRRRARARLASRLRIL